jgi:hypothetical protein
MISVNGQFRGLRKAPLSRWDIDRSFDNAASCNAWLDYRLRTNAGVGQPGRPRGNSDDLYWLELHGNASCIASDDPRLAK